MEPGFIAQEIEDFCKNNEFMDTTEKRHKGLLTGDDLAIGLQLLKNLYLMITKIIQFAKLDLGAKDQLFYSN